MGGGAMGGGKDPSPLMGAYMKGSTKHFKKGAIPQRSNSNDSRGKGGTLRTLGSMNPSASDNSLSARKQSDKHPNM